MPAFLPFALSLMLWLLASDSVPDRWRGVPMKGD